MKRGNELTESGLELDVVLRLLSDTLDVRAMSDLLGVEPTVAFDRGETYVVQAAEAPVASWNLQSRLSGDVAFDDHVVDLFQMVSPDRLKQAMAVGVEGDVSVVASLVEPDGGFCVTPLTSELLGRYGLALVVSIRAATDSSG